MRIAAVIPAAGSGDRLGAGIPKALRTIGGLSMLRRAADGLAELVQLVVVAAPVEYIDDVSACLGGLPIPVQVVAGGRTRQLSVRACVDVLPPDVQVVLVHDAARPLTPVSVMAAVLAAVVGGAAAVVPVVPVTDTLKLLGPGGVIVGTVDRATLGAVQTPQGFRRDVLARAHAQRTTSATDDAALVEALGIDVQTVPGDPAGFKVTTMFDLRVAELLLSP